DGKKWTAKKIYFSSHHMRTYLVEKKIESGSKRALAGIRFTPGSKDDRLLIKNIRIYIADTPL
ncbi:MAG: hypothetical protein GY765_15615, partial [bacterium]|nr:hypothetical protein [bacterium]